MTLSPPVATWEVIPMAPPQPIRHCATCATSRNFTSSGRVRLNANGKKLDAWLIYKCAHCDQTWNRPLRERLPVSKIAKSDLEAMQQSLPAWVRPHEFDAAELRKHCEDLHYATRFTVRKSLQSDVKLNWSEIRLQVSSTLRTGLRLERVLCEGWCLSRSQLRRTYRSGNLLIDPDVAHALRKPLHGLVSIRALSEGLSHELWDKFCNGLFESS